MTLAILALPLFSVVTFADEIAWDGIVSLDTVEVIPGEHFGVKVRLSNSDLAISGLEIPLKYSSPFLTLDSVSFTGSFKPDNFSGLVYHDPEKRTVKITYIPDEFANPLPAITAPSGIIGELFFTLSPEATSQVISVDSINHDTLIGAGIHWWIRVQFSDNDGMDTYLPLFVPGGIIVRDPTAVGDEDANSLLPSEFDLAQNYPNPFNPSTVIKFSLPRGSHVKLEVFNVLGQRVDILINQWRDAGVHQAVFDANRQPSGIYFYRLTSDVGSQTQKMVLLK